jgi:OOP family OmpA-OmpF porin
MRLQLWFGRSRITLAMAIGLVAPGRTSADVITIDDGGRQGTTSIPFTCTIGSEEPLWLPSMGFVYRNVEAFELSPGDTIAFDLQMGAQDPPDLGFLPQLDIALAHASDPLNPFKPDELPGSDFTVVAHAAIAASPGNLIAGDYDLVFTVDAPFSFPGGGLIIRVNNPQGPLAVKDFQDCLFVIIADAQPTGTNRLVGTFKLESGEYPWMIENTSNTPDVPYVRISWTRCGDGRVSGAEVCDDGNADNTDECTSSCRFAACGDGFISSTEECDDGNADDTDECTSSCRFAACGDGFVSGTEECDDGNADDTDECTRCRPAACGDGVVQVSEDCDNSANPDNPDPFCNDSCHVAAFAKGSGCGIGGGAGLAAALMILAFARRRRATKLVVLVGVFCIASARAQSKTDGFRVDRFAMAPSVDDGLVVQDPSVLRNMVWSMNATLGFTNTLLRVVPRLSSDQGVDVVGPRFSAYLDFAMGFRERFELNVSLPFALAQSTESGTAAGIMLKSAGSSMVGDARVGGSVLLYNRRTGPQLGLAATMAIPIGSENSFTGDGGVGAELVAMAGLGRPRYRVIMNGGVRFRPGADYVSTDQGTELIGRAAILVPFANHRLMTSLELDLIARASGRDAYEALGSPVLAMLGARYHFAGGLRAGAGVGMGLTDSPGSPTVRVIVTVGYSPEPTKPAKPIKPEPPPPPVDRDGDRIPDRLDKCPTNPEDLNGFEDDDGCPDGPPDPDAPLTLEQVITLPSPIEFYFDTAIMRPGAERYLLQVLDILQKHPEVVKLEIQGHTSSEGGAAYNMRLSIARTKTVFKWLVDRGIDGNRFVPHGYGLTQPLVPNDSEPNRQRNRRVQFRLLEQLPGSPPVDSLPRAPPPPATPSPATPPPATPPPATPPPATPPPAM